MQLIINIMLSPKKKGETNVECLKETTDNNEYNEECTLLFGVQRMTKNFCSLSWESCNRFMVCLQEQKKHET